MNDFVNEISAVFAKNRDIENAVGMKRYMRNQFDFLGLKKPLRSYLQKPFLKQAHLPEAEEIPEIIHYLWLLPEREYQYFALDLLEQYTKISSTELIKLYEFLIITKSWWDTVDMIAGKFVGSLFFKDFAIQKEYLHKWLQIDNLWLLRTCILYQLKYKEHTDTEQLKRIIHQTIPTEEFFINKAIGWILREYSKTNPAWVKEFVKTEPLHKLSKKEALKWLKKKGKF